VRSAASVAAIAVAVVLFVVLWAMPAGADGLNVRERYEEALLQSAMTQLAAKRPWSPAEEWTVDTSKLMVDPAPEGKTIERIVVWLNQVILPGDFPLSKKIPWTWANHLHVRTREYIVRQELLFHVGEPLRTDLIEESGRNLRAMFILAVARIVVLRGSTPDRVVVLVVTKDNWTLRLNTDFAVDQARLDSLSFSISESNLAGRNKTVSVQYALDPGRHTVGLGFADPRMGGSRHQLKLLGDVFLTRNGGGVEGGLGQLTVGRPLYSLRTQWGWQLDLTYLQDLVRQFQGGDLRMIQFGDELIPDVYARRVITGNLVGSRSFGVLDKLILSAGFRVTDARYHLPDNFPPTLSQAARDAYTAILPRSESASGPFLSASAYRASYVRLQNIDTYALSEDFRTGPTASVEVRFADPAFGFDSSFITFSGSYGATYWGRDNLVSLLISGTARLQGGVVPNTLWVNQVVSAGFRDVTPRFGPFRLHLAGALQLRRNDLTNARVTLGSDNGLRGFAPREFVGNNLYRVNVELRSISANLWTIHVGGVLFYDGGDAPATLATASWHQDVGFGLRILFPQFNHDVLRLDLAFPLERPSMGSYAPRFSVSFGQAF
jgi:hypothetical protein